jgi:hypothetical protein
MATRNLMAMSAFANNLLTEFGKMRLRSRIAICTRVILAVAFVIAGLVKITYLA